MRTSAAFHLPAPTDASATGGDLFGWGRRGWRHRTSTLTVDCLGAAAGRACAGLGFRLSVIGDHRVDGMALLNTRTDLWNFQSVRAVSNTDGPVNWSSFTPSGGIFGLSLDAAVGYGVPRAEPLYVEIGLVASSSGTARRMEDIFRYAAKGYDDLAPSTYTWWKKAKEERYFTKGVATASPPPPTVTPEPMSFVLLVTGLVGLAALRRRRKQEIA